MSKTPEIGSRTRTRAIMEKYGIHTKKGFGQNFLTDLNVLKNIVSAAEISKDDNVIEIGPGIGALTEQLAQAAGEVLALEIDQDLIPVLAEVLAPYDNVAVLNQDVLQANLPELIKQQFADPAKPVKVVANLPYYITSPILMNLLAAPVDWAAICVMMQKEVAQRLTAQPGTKQYGALTLAIEYQMTAEIAFNVSRRVFVPASNVDSAIVALKPRATPLAVEPFDKQKLFGFIRACFAHRRKSLWNNLQAAVGKQPAVKEQLQAILTQLAISPQTRPERLTLEQFIKLANALHAAQLL